MPAVPLALALLETGSHSASIFSRQNDGYDDSDSSSGLSSYVITRIVIAVVIAAMSICFGLVFRVVRRRRQRQVEAARPTAVTDRWHQYVKAEMPSESRYPDVPSKAVISKGREGPSTYVHELEANEVAANEMKGAPSIREIDSRSLRRERRESKSLEDDEAQTEPFLAHDRREEQA